MELSSSFSWRRLTIGRRLLRRIRIRSFHCFTRWVGRTPNQGSLYSLYVEKGRLRVLKHAYRIGVYRHNEILVRFRGLDMLETAQTTEVCQLSSYGRG
jgi:hypothetical protein